MGAAISASLWPKSARYEFSSKASGWLRSTGDGSLTAFIAQSMADKKKEEEKNKDNEGLVSESEDDEDELEEVVFVLEKGGKVKKVVVTTGIQDINYIEILSGLKEGDEVITDPYSAVSKTLKDGMKVKVVPKDKLFEK